MIAARPSLRTLVGLEFEKSYLRARPDMREASVENIFSAINLLEVFSEQEVFCDQLDRDLLLDFRAWRLEERPPPKCEKHDYMMHKVRGTKYLCPQPGCREKAAHAPAVVAATANKDVRTLRALWQWAIDCGYNTRPLQRIVKLKEDLDNQEAWTLEEFGRILASCRQQPDELFVPCRMADLCEALAWVLYDVGSRISAVMNARPADLDWISGTLTLRAGTKKDRECQVYKLSDEALEALKKIYNPSNEFLIPWPHDRTRRQWPALTERWKEILRRAGLSSGKKDVFHKMRRLTATQTVIETGDIREAQRLLGHSQESVTKRYLDQRQLIQANRAGRILPRPRVEP